MPTNKKPFDAARMMRSIRDALSEQIKYMTFEEERAYIRQRLRDEPVDGNSSAELEGSVQSRSAVDSGGKP